MTNQSASNQTDQGFIAHFGHRAFNERFLPQANTASMPDVVSAPWLSNEAIEKLPAVRREFDRNRDPFIAAQSHDLTKSEAERREGQTGRGSKMVKQDRPKANLNPPEQTRKAVDNNQFKSRWLAESRDAAMAQHREAIQSTPQQHTVSIEYNPPDR